MASGRRLGFLVLAIGTLEGAVGFGCRSGVACGVVAGAGAETSPANRERTTSTLSSGSARLAIYDLHRLGLVPSPIDLARGVQAFEHFCC